MAMGVRVNLLIENAVTDLISIRREETCNRALILRENLMFAELLFKIKATGTGCSCTSEWRKLVAIVMCAARSRS